MKIVGSEIFESCEQFQTLVAQVLSPLINKHMCVEGQQCKTSIIYGVSA